MGLLGGPLVLLWGRMIELAFRDIPRIPLWQPTMNVAMSPKLEGYEYWFHRQLDVRPLKPA